jgi:hypothetical protein
MVNPRLGADAAADWPGPPFRLRKGFSFCHQLTFSADREVDGVVGEVPSGGIGWFMRDRSTPACSSGIQLCCDWRVRPFGPLNDRSIVPFVPSHERTCFWLIVRPSGSV